MRRPADAESASSFTHGVRMLRRGAQLALVRSWLFRVYDLFPKGPRYFWSRQTELSITETADRFQYIDPLTTRLFGRTDEEGFSALVAFLSNNQPPTRVQSDLTELYQRVKKLRDVCEIIVRGKPLGRTERPERSGRVGYSGMVGKATFDAMPIFRTRRMKLLGMIDWFYDRPNLDAIEMAWLYACRPMEIRDWVTSGILKHPSSDQSSLRFGRGDVLYAKAAEVPYDSLWTEWTWRADC